VKLSLRDNFPLKCQAALPGLKHFPLIILKSNHLKPFYLGIIFYFRFSL